MVTLPYLHFVLYNATKFSMHVTKWLIHIINFLCFRHAFLGQPKTASLSRYTWILGLKVVIMTYKQCINDL